MKNLKTIIFALVALLTLTACPNDPDPDPVNPEVEKPEQKPEQEQEQQQEQQPTGIDDSHDVVTDQPAYSR